MNTGVKEKFCGVYDMGWQLRGSGRTFNSMSEHGSLTSSVNDRFLSLWSRVTSCGFCEKASSENRETNPHDCRRKWQGSSKVMEPSAAVELAKNYAVLIFIKMDDHTTATARLKSERNPEIVKWSDVNYAKKVTVFFALQIGSKTQKSNIKKKYFYHTY